MIDQMNMCGDCGLIFINFPHLLIFVEIPYVAIEKLEKLLPLFQNSCTTLTHTQFINYILIVFFNEHIRTKVI